MMSPVDFFIQLCQWRMQVGRNRAELRKSRFSVRKHGRGWTR